MPDHRRHRGPHPEDKHLFARENLAALRKATRDLCWLLSRGYADRSALKLVGDRHALDARQRTAVARCSCSEAAEERRHRHETSAAELAARELWIDGYNVLTTIEAALSGGVVLHARDGCFRDMASMHGSYRKVEETVPAIHLAGDVLSPWKPSACRWFLDQPVSNSGRLKTLLAEIAEERGWTWQVEVVADPDSILRDTDQIVATADSQILDRVEHWFNLARSIVDAVETAWIVDLSGRS